MIGIVALFAALGPAVGGALFIPLSVVFKPTIAPDAIALLVLIAALFGHAVGLFAAYVVGVGPAAATGFLYALWDAAAPARWPRALVAAVIGGLIAYGLALRLAPDLGRRSRCRSRHAARQNGSTAASPIESA